jgi:N-acetylglucosaminyldiphosphoundecaprenol N-acetyl-beta-D-mannosaminyltransferase
MNRRDEEDPLSSDRTRVDVLGVLIDALDPLAALEIVSGWVRGGAREYVCVTGVHGVMESQRDPQLALVHNQSGLTVPDGMPLVWCCHRAGRPATRRIYGPDLMLAVLQRAAENGWSNYFYGGAEGVAELLAQRMCTTFPDLIVGGTESPPFRQLTEQEGVAVRTRINTSGAQLVWVGLSTPKQERWMAQHRAGLEAAALIGVGAAFDFHTGRVRQAPPWMQRHGLEWLFRLLVEPRRLWRRYARNNPRFVLSVLRRRPRAVEP